MERVGGVQPDTLTSTRWFAQALTAPSALTLSCRWYVCFVRFVPLSTFPLCVRVSVCVHLRVCMCVYVCVRVCECVSVCCSPAYLSACVYAGDDSPHGWAVERPAHSRVCDCGSQHGPCR